MKPLETIGAIPVVCSPHVYTEYSGFRYDFTTSTLIVPSISAGSVSFSSIQLNGSTSGSTTLQAQAVASGTITIPSATDTLIGKATTDTLTNKTFDTAGAGNVLRINGTQVSAVTGSGSVVLATSPTLVTPLLGTPTSGTLTNCTGLPISSGVSGLGTGVATALAVNVGSAGALVVNGGALGTPSSGTLTSCTGLPISTGVSGLGANVATFLATPTSANLASAVTDETGSGALVFATSPTLVTPNIGVATATSLTVGVVGGQATMASWFSNTAHWINLPTTGPSGIGSGGAGVNPWVSYAATSGNWFSDSSAGDICYRNTGGKLLFGISTGAYNMALLASGNLHAVGSVGIGTASPGTKLEVFGSITARAASTQDAVILTGRAGGTGSFGVSLTPTTLTANRTVTLADGNTTLQAGTMAITGGTLAQFAATTSAQLAGVISDETGSGSLVFGTSPTIATPTITTSATVPLVIGGTGTTSTLTLRSTSGVGTTGADIILQAGNNGATELMRLMNSGNIGIKTASPRVTLHTLNGTQITAVPGAGTYGGPVIVGNDNTLYGMYIGSISSGAGYIQQQRGDSATTYPLLLQPNGDNVLIGYTTSNGAYKLQVNSQIFATNATIATSDRRYKKDIMPIQSGLDVISKLNPVSFTWKEHDIHQFDSGTQVGFIAQDVQDALGGERYSDCVVKRNQVQLKDGSMEEFYGLSDSKLIPLIVKSIQELNAKLEELTGGKGNMISREVL